MGRGRFDLRTFYNREVDPRFYNRGVWGGVVLTSALFITGGLTPGFITGGSTPGNLMCCLFSQMLKNCVVSMSAK